MFSSSLTFDQDVAAAQRTPRALAHGLPHSCTSVTIPGKPQTKSNAIHTAKGTGHASLKAAHRDGWNIRLR